ncbi:MAG: ACT domain-containing protein [Clostridia bacterium]|nr:ACT domain-containing protein [Clostridia bacterium]
MKAIVAVIGQDKKGIIAKVSTLLYEKNVNIIDISQTIMEDMFVMTAMVDTKDCSVEFDQLRHDLTDLGEEIGVQITIQRKNIFESMHRI